jgi:hypothetical protein
MLRVHEEVPAQSAYDELIELDAHEEDIVDGIVGIGAHDALIA